jgi:hypothetical protein
MADQLVTIGKKPCRSVFQRLQPQTGIKAVDDIIGRLEDEIARSQAAIVECLSRAQALTLPAGVGGGSTQLSAFTIPFVWRRPETVPSFGSVTPNLFWIQPATLDATDTEEIARGLTEPGFVAPVPVSNLTLTALVTDIAVGKTLHWDLFKNVDSGDDRATLVGDGLLVATGSFAPSTLLSRQVWGPVAPLVAIHAGDSLHLSISFDEGPGALQCDFLLACNALNGVSAVAGTPGAPGVDGRPGRAGFGEDGSDGEDGVPGPRGRDGKRGRAGAPGSPGEDGEDGEDGRPGRDGITPQTYFDLELSYGREDGVGTLAAFGTGGEGSPDFYLRPNTDLNVLTVGTGSPGEVWEYEVTRALQGTLTLDLYVYQCLITPQPATTATITASVTKNTATILTSPNLDGISGSGARVVVTLAGVSYNAGDRIGVHVQTTNFASGTLMMTAHVSCEELVIAASSIVGPVGPAGPKGDSVQGPPGLDAQEWDDASPMTIPGPPGAPGVGLQGLQGVPGIPGADAEAVAAEFIPPTRGASGANGANGTNGTNGIDAFDSITANATQPNVGSAVTVTMVKPAWISVGQVIYVELAGYYTVNTVVGTSVSLINLGYPGNLAPGGTILLGASVSAAGLIGASGTAGVGAPGIPGGDGIDGAPGEFIPPSVVSSAGGITQLTGDVTAGPGSGSQAATNVNAPDGFTHAGKVVVTVITAPATPAAGKASQYVDSTSKNLCSKDDGGNVNHGIRTRGATASNWIRSVADDGSTTISQPAFTDISGTAALSQLGNGAALSVLGNASGAASTRADIAAGSGSDFPLREHSGGLGFGTLATAAYGANSVSYAKLQATSAGKVLLGRDVGAGTVQEIGLDATLKMTSGLLGEVQPYGWSLTFGGNISSSIGTTLPVYLGIGDTSWSTSSSMGMLAPSASAHQDWATYVINNGLIGSGTLQIDLMKNGVSQGAIAFFNIGSGGGYLTPNQTVLFAAGDIIGIKLLPFAGSTITGGNINLYVVGRFAF